MDNSLLGNNLMNPLIPFLHGQFLNDLTFVSQPDTRYGFSKLREDSIIPATPAAQSISLEVKGQTGNEQE